MILTLVLSVSILSGCKTAKVAEKPDETTAREILVAMLPESPEPPEFPSLRWTYKDGLYGLEESDVDKLLDFKENTLPAFSGAYLDWLAQLRIVLRELAAE